MLLLIAAVAGHVPTYSGCKDGCCTPPHHHDVSQVIYVKGSGGLEIHFSDLSTPFDISGGEILDVDAVFAKEYDLSTYELRIGCGGCVASVDRIVIPPVALDGYQPGEVEPFTQTAYRSVFKKEDRKYDTSQLATCDQGHFSITVKDFHNRTDGSTLVWGAVIGLKESFTFTELLSFPIFVLRNHDNWNQVGWTYWIILPLSIPLWWLERAGARRSFGWKWVSPFDPEMAVEPRAWLYEFAIISFMAAAGDMLVHLIIAQSNAEFGYQFWVGLGVVILFSNGFPIAITMLTWQGMYHRADNWVISRWWWAPIEMASAFSYLFLFGAGFFIGPALVFLAATIRMLDWLEIEWKSVFTGRVPTASRPTTGINARPVLYVRV